MFQTNMKEVVLQKKEIESPIQISTREAPVELNISHTTEGHVQIK